MKFIHSADWQLGKSFGRFDTEVRSALGDARYDVIGALGNAAAEHGARHVLVAGDVFDTEGPDDRTIVQALSRMGAMPATGGCCQATTILPAMVACGTGCGSAPGNASPY